MADKPKGRAKVSFALYIAGAFVLTAIMTVLITASAIVIVWNAGRGTIFTDQDLYLALAVGGLIALVLSVVLGLYFASGIGQPIQRISKVASAIKEGDLTARTGLTGEDELGQLGESFDEMADSIERDRDLERQLIGDVAHELRTPLMAVQATVEAIQDGVFPADEEHLNTISSETRRLSRLVDALLHLNRLENGTTEVKIELVDMSALINELATTHEALIESSGIDFRTNIAVNVLVDGDCDLITQAIANLLSNAVRYTPEGGSVELSLSREDGYAKVSVTDTGIGISQEDLKKVFSRFWRADSARENVNGGLGIGLSLVKEVADQHSGHVSVDSVLGEGSVFSIFIPLAEEDTGQEGVIHRRGSSARKDARAAKKEQERDARAAKKEQERDARAAKKEQERLRREEERLRKEDEKLRKLEERQQRNKRTTQEKDRKLFGATQQEILLFGFRVARSRQKDSDEQEDEQRK